MPENRTERLADGMLEKLLFWCADSIISGLTGATGLVGHLNECLCRQAIEEGILLIGMNSHSMQMMII